MLFFPFIPFRISRGLTNYTDGMNKSLSSYTLQKIKNKSEANKKSDSCCNKIYTTNKISKNLSAMEYPTVIT